MMVKNISLLIVFYLIVLSGSCQPVKIKASSENELFNFLEREGRPPGQYLIEKFNDHDVILLAEEHMIKENLQFIQGIIPELYKAGVYNLGMEFGASEDQQLLDSLVTAEEYDERLARKIMFNYNVAWPYVEYMDVYRHAWMLNKSLPEGARKFRILNISYQFDWSEFKGERSPENMKKVFHKGGHEKYRAQIIEKEVLVKNEKILVLTGTNHAFTHYKEPVFNYLAEDYCRFENGNMGNLLYEKYQERIYSVVIHQYFRNQINKEPRLLSPGNGLVEELLCKNGNSPLGFDLKETPLGEIADSSYYSMGYTDFTLQNIFDGYIFLKPINQLKGCTVDSKFLEDRNWKNVVDQFPDPDWHGRPDSISDYWKFVTRNAMLNY
nr:hypothetical protein [uncultured Draconibacterium sp.]